MLLILLFVLLFGYFVARGVNSPSLSNLFKHSSEFEKQPIEMIASVKQEFESDNRTIHYGEYVAVKKRKNREAQVQVISMPESDLNNSIKIFLN